ncbi:DUF7260 family protein [Natronobacterium gregoryi]|uniref:DUF7260 domain-containing protein n=2 Tax=Natronobacterium gregoryi TaxID=44930 RepID=L0AHI4_NATGS|nr:hypothetical protein [Natronobacterium gregoryi]AFZ72597.1 hypothetical protein Natgr_1386 [Natronobacterium gregoryi SP2]ELY71975.1 hypothetical protein C490_04407 [Natronobacterium gregoryi SP2]PLK19197.1 hypothetical protein CYV19_16065 [Natronobacterium gregoryi SP2]SFJ57346.1 hypothetical protein SAMN05443661_1416 [Natronobacterium gregoryi]
MTVELDSPLHEALEHVTEELGEVTGKLAAVDRFVKGVDDLSPATPNASPHVTDGGRITASRTVSTVQYGPSESATAACRRDVRNLFAETIHPYAVDDIEQSEPVLTLIGEEFGQDVAVALAPSTDHQFTPDLKQAVLSAARQRRAELEAMKRALKIEVESLRTTKETVTELVNWLVEVDETPLLDLGFEELRRRHETLADHRAACRRLLEKRQSVLHGTTTYNATAGLAHRTLVTYLYRELPTSYPALSTVLRLLEQCRTCQRAVRDHLTRRV